MFLPSQLQNLGKGHCSETWATGSTDGGINSRRQDYMWAQCSSHNLTLLSCYINSHGTRSRMVDEGNTVIRERWVRCQSGAMESCQGKLCCFRNTLSSSATEPVSPETDLAPCANAPSHQHDPRGARGRPSVAVRDPV